MIYKFQIHQAAIFLILFSGNVLSAQKIKTDWVKLEQQFASTSLKEYFYKKGSLFNEAEGISEDEEIPSALFFSSADPENKNKAFILAFQSSDQFKQDGIMPLATAYQYAGKRAFYWDNNFMQCLYIVLEPSQIVSCIVFRKEAQHDQKFIEHLFDALKVEEIIKGTISY
jgi:hypothetical protein